MKKILSFLNLLDRSQRLSLTNLALYVLITKIALLRDLSVADGAVLFLGILNYMHKRFETSKSSNNEQRVLMDEISKVTANFDERLKVIKDEIGKVALANGMFKR